MLHQQLLILAALAALTNANARPGVLQTQCVNNNETALAFVGPDAVSQTTLDYLASNGLTAFFFVTPETAESNAAILKKAIIAGNMVGLTLPDVSTPLVGADLQTAKGRVGIAVGCSIDYATVPGASYNILYGSYGAPMLYSNYTSDVINSGLNILYVPFGKDDVTKSGAAVQYYHLANYVYTEIVVDGTARNANDTSDAAVRYNATLAFLDARKNVTDAFTSTALWEQPNFLCSSRAAITKQVVPIQRCVGVPQLVCNYDTPVVGNSTQFGNGTTVTTNGTGTHGKTSIASSQTSNAIMLFITALFVAALAV